MIAKQQTITIRLRPETDPAEPTLQGIVTEGFQRAIAKVRVTTRHPIWHGAELIAAHFRMVSPRKRTAAKEAAV